MGEAVFDDPLVQELLEARLVAVLSTFDEAGIIHAVPMWFALDDERSVLLATGSRSRKVRNLERDVRATLVVHDSRPGFEVCGVSMAGEVEVVSGAAARPLVDRVHRRYVTEAAEADEIVSPFLESDDVALRFCPAFGHHVGRTRERREPDGCATSAVLWPLVPDGTSPVGANYLGCASSL